MVAAAAAANGARFLFNPAKHDCIAFLGVSRGLATDCGASFYDFFFPIIVICDPLFVTRDQTPYIRLDFVTFL